MGPFGIFQLASRQAEHLTVRQSVVASNIANANTPKYISNDTEPFQAVLDETTSTALRTTHANHITEGGAANKDIEVNSTGKPVGLAEELMKSMEIRHEYDLNTGLVKSLNKMMLLTVRK